MWVVHLLIAFALLLAHYFSRSAWGMLSVLVGIVGLYFLFRGLEGATEYFDSSGTAESPAGPPVNKASDTVPGLVWNGDLSQLPDIIAGPRAAPMSQPSIEYPGVVPLSIQPEANPGLEQAPLQVAADPLMVKTHIRLQPEEPMSGDESTDGVTRKP